MRTRLLLLAFLTATGQLSAQDETVSAVSSPTVTEQSAVKSTSSSSVDSEPESVSPNPSISNIGVLTEDKPASIPAPTPVAATNSKDTLSVDFPDEEIRTILRNVADLFELNLVIPDTLQGRASLKLREVTWRQIFNVVLSQVGYAFIEDGNIIKIVSRDTLSAEPFTTTTLVIDNVAAASIEPLLRSILTPSRPANGTDPGAPGGSIVLNSLANELIITDQSVTISRIIATAKRLDSEPRQVVIETKFVELTRDQGRELAVGLAGKQNIGGGAGTAAGALNTLGQVMPAAIATGSPSLGKTGSFNALLNSQDYSILLKAFDSLSGTRIVSNPTIVAINGSKSEINIGTDFQLVTATQTAPTGGGTPTVTYSAGGKVFEGVKVEVTPQITSNKLVSLSLKTEKSNARAFSVGEGVTAQTFYDINKREGTLNMILQDGQTAAIGGLMDTKDSKVDTKVPILGDIPVLGNLFKSKNSQKVETNLIIFITASILEPSKTTYRNIATQTQISNLDITERDIQGVGYKVEDAEKQLYQDLDVLRKQKQDAEIAEKLKIEKDAKTKALREK
jgi:type IV pilus assembly protein PilQ